LFVDKDTKTGIRCRRVRKKQKKKRFQEASSERESDGKMMKEGTGVDKGPTYLVKRIFRSSRKTKIQRERGKLSGRDWIKKIISGRSS